MIKKRPTRTDRERAKRIHTADVRRLERLAERLNNRRPALVDPIELVYRYLRRFDGILPWHKGGDHVARYNFGPMIARSRATGRFYVEPREVAA